MFDVQLLDVLRHRLDYVKGERVVARRFVGLSAAAHVVGEVVERHLFDVGRLLEGDRAVVAEHEFDAEQVDDVALVFDLPPGLERVGELPIQRVLVAVLCLASLELGHGVFKNTECEFSSLRPAPTLRLGLRSVRL